LIDLAVSSLQKQGCAHHLFGAGLENWLVFVQLKKGISHMENMLAYY